MSLREITDPDAIATLETGCSIRTPSNHNQPDLKIHVVVTALVYGLKINGFAQTDTLSNNNIMFKYKQPQLLFPDRMEYMGAFVGKNQWCYPSPKKCRFEDGECFIHS